MIEDNGLVRPDAISVSNLRFLTSVSETLALVSAEETLASLVRGRLYSSSELAKGPDCRRFLPLPEGLSGLAASSISSKYFLCQTE